MIRTLLIMILGSVASTVMGQWNVSSSNIYTNNNNVGIGQSSPGFKLDIYTTTSLQGIQLYHSSGRWARFFAPSMTGGAYNSITVSNDAGIIYGNLAGGIDAVTNGLVFAPHRSSVSGMRLTPTGTVGIGTTLVNNPNGYVLAVNGKIGAKEVMVENTSSTWADYVFEETYHLATLSEVEAFIKENKHLPEIPSAEEISLNGHKLGEMDVLLLKKIEELTLYVIELKKENEQINELKESIKKLSEKIEELEK